MESFGLFLFEAEELCDQDHGSLDDALLHIQLYDL